MGTTVVPRNNRSAVTKFIDNIAFYYQFPRQIMQENYILRKKNKRKRRSIWR